MTNKTKILNIRINGSTVYSIDADYTPNMTGYWVDCTSLDNTAIDRNLINSQLKNILNNKVTPKKILDVLSFLNNYYSVKFYKMIIL